MDYGATSATITVDVGEKKQKDAAVEQKEQPVWMTESTVEGAATAVQVDQVCDSITLYIQKENRVF